MTQGGVTVIGCVQADVVMSPVSELPPAGGTLLAERMSIRLGGAGANAALAFAETEMPTRLVGAVGDDMLGRWMREQLAPAGLADDLIVVPGEPTGLTVALESPSRDRTFLTYLGVNNAWEPSMIGDHLLDCRHLLLCDYFVAPALQGAAASALLAAAHAHGATTCFDTAYDPGGFAPATRDEVRGLLKSVDIFLPNEAEAWALAGRPAGGAPDAARQLQRDSGGWVVVKLGSRGCFAVGPGGTELQAAAPAVEVADTTGAGDAFNAGLVHALSGGASWPDALQAATTFASTIVSRPSDARHLLGAQR